jgi:predicted DNA-binding transcriptional regulator AlpA
MLNRTSRERKLQPTTKFLSVPDLMERWDVSRQTIERWWRIKPDFPKTYRFPGSSIRKFKEADVEAFERLALKGGRAEG